MITSKIKFFPFVKSFWGVVLFFLVGLGKPTYLGAAEAWQIGFQSPATPLMEGIINFHNHIMFFMFGVGIFVLWLLGRCLVLYSENSNTAKVDNFTHATLVEIVWTIVPALILVVIAVPSFALLYSMDEMLDPAVTLKVVGHQCSCKAFNLNTG